MKPQTRDELLIAIAETDRQEKCFRLANNPFMTAYWILERVKLRSQLFLLLQNETLR